jgi:hypothetical protein
MQEPLREDATAFWKQACRMDAMLSSITPKSGESRHAFCVQVHNVTRERVLRPLRRLSTRLCWCAARLFPA